MVSGLLLQLCKRLICALGGLLLVCVAQAATPAVALYYGSGIPLSEFRAFDLVVVDPDHGAGKPDVLQPGTRIYAYASVGEVLPSRAYERDIPPEWKFAHNPDWKSDVIDLSTPVGPIFSPAASCSRCGNRAIAAFFSTRWTPTVWPRALMSKPNSKVWCE